MTFAAMASWLLLVYALLNFAKGACVEAAIYLSASLILRAMVSMRKKP